MADEQLSAAYAAGHDAGKHGPSVFNCDYRHFATPALTAEWERGKKDAEAERDGKQG